MNDFQQYYEHSANYPNWQTNKTNDYIEYCLTLPDGTCKTTVYPLLPGISLMQFDVNAKNVPAEYNDSASANLIQFNYCTEGSIELLLDDNSYFYLTKNNFSISCQDAASSSFFPTNHYQGITIYFDMNVLSDPKNSFYNTLDLDFSKLSQVYLNKTKTFVAEPNQELQTIINNIMHYFENPSPFYMRLLLIEFLHLLLSNKICSERHRTFYTNIQVEIAKNAERVLTADISNHIPIRQLAEQFSVSETSLKNYFKYVYGQNISDYMRTLRMNTAAKLLAETTLPVSEVSNRVGYIKQGKFAAVFRQQYNMNPLEYRRMSKLDKLK